MISILHTIPEALHELMLQHLDESPRLDRDHLLTAALAYYLMLERDDGQSRQQYLEAMLGGRRNESTY